MKGKYMERLVGKYCKIVTKEPGEERANVINGILEDVDYKDGFILVDSSQGLGCLRIDTIIAIKPGQKHGLEKKPIAKDEHADVGIGSLIVFIAAVLVAAIAASILVQTAETLQQRAYSVGKQTIREVSSGMKIVDMTGYTDSGRTKLEYLALTVKLRAGSYDIDLRKTLLYVAYNNLTVLNLSKENMNATVAPGGIFHTLNNSNLTSTIYGVIATHDADGSVTNNYGMSVDDTVILVVNLSACFQENHGLLPNEKFDGRLVPELGSAGTFRIETPNTFEHRIVQL
jgi:flagellin FlaB